MRKSRGSKTSQEPKKVTPAFLKKWPVPRPDDDGDKESRGRVLIVGGSQGMSGAITLTAVAALRAGAGKLTIATPGSIASSVATAVLEGYVLALPNDSSGVIKKASAALLLKHLGNVDAMVIGPAMDSSPAGEKVLASVITEILKKADRKNLVLDAGAIKALKGRPELTRDSKSQVIITPHAGEMASLTDIPKEEVTADPARIASRFAAEYRVTVALKGSETIIAEPSGQLFRNVNGNAGLGTSGSGDVLAGIVGGLAARNCEPAQAAVWGVYLHAVAGDRLAREIGPVGYLARELLDWIPREMRKLGST